eukprot:6213760-Pleurochrysis_carterae.AAC.3
MIRGKEKLVVQLYVDDIITAHTRGSSLHDGWARDFLSHFHWTNFSTTFQEFVLIRLLRQSPGVIRLDSERYITELANEIFLGGINANCAEPARPELPSLIDNVVRHKEDSINMMNLNRQTRYGRIVNGMLKIAITTWPDV